MVERIGREKRGPDIFILYGGVWRAVSEPEMTV